MNRSQDTSTRVHKTQHAVMSGNTCIHCPCPTQSPAQLPTTRNSQVQLRLQTTHTLLPNYTPSVQKHRCRLTFRAGSQHNPDTPHSRVTKNWKPGGRMGCPTPTKDAPSQALPLLLLLLLCMPLPPAAHPPPGADAYWTLRTLWNCCHSCCVLWQQPEGCSVLHEAPCRAYLPLE
jgi:hypothetical protein